jgi:tetratricopeptide (TPR) repeat protein
MPMGLLVLLTGCVTLEVETTTLTEKVDAAFDAHEYQRAQALLAQLPQEDRTARMVSREAWLARMTRHLEQAILMQAAAQLRREQWLDALASYDRGLAMLPDSAPLRAARDTARAQHEGRLTDLQVRLLMARGRSLAALRPIYAELIRVDPANVAAARELERIREESREVADDLQTLGRLALEAEELRLAVDALSLSQALMPADDTLEMLHAAQQARADILATQRQADHARRQAAWEARSRELFDRYHEAMQSSDLTAASQHLKGLERTRPRDDSLPRLQRELDQAIDTRITLGLEEGRRQYLDGDIERAVETWRELLDLRPNHVELQAHVQRAERVLESLRGLEGEPQPVTVPVPQPILDVGEPAAEAQ